jgi:hypothetical protein
MVPSHGLTSLAAVVRVASRQHFIVTVTSCEGNARSEDPEHHHTFHVSEVAQGHRRRS